MSRPSIGLRRCEAETKAYTITGRLFDPVNHQCQNSATFLSAGFQVCGTHMRMLRSGKSVTFVKEGYEFIGKQEKVRGIK